METQLSGPKMTLAAWAAYFGAPAAQRQPLLNVVSLRLAGTPLQACCLLPGAPQATSCVSRHSLTLILLVQLSFVLDPSKTRAKHSICGHLIW